MSDRPNMINQDQFRRKMMDIILKHCDSRDYYGCMPWADCKNRAYGHMSYTYQIIDYYGKIASDQGYTAPHRLMFAVVYNQLHLLDPSNRHIQVSHICHTPTCCNPLHLEIEDKKLNGSRTKCKAEGKCTTHDPPCILKKLR